jgi:hypothetical protein
MGIFKPKVKEVISGWRILHDEELPCFHSASHILRVMKSKCGMHGRDKNCIHKFDLETPDFERRILLKFVLKKGI